MRRIALWILSTAAVVTLLFGYKTSLSGPATPTVAVSAAAAPAKSSIVTNTSGTTTTVTGAVAQTRWGPVQVAITVTAGKITAVDVPVYPNGNGRDAQINAYALPILTGSTLTAQSANIDMVSGATVTSDGYVQSLQSALDQAHL
ncbi:FMN-binding protein [Pseudonocardia sp. GCM10023141]|uniref:FMN-binding protein n=1 Tax=Pseudonocardia sp. GCM10023141 TaxID=3252653 RepID=UPI0036066DA7